MIEETQSSRMIGAFLLKHAFDKGNIYRVKVGRGPKEDRLRKLFALLNQEGYFPDCHPFEDYLSLRLKDCQYYIYNIAEKYTCFRCQAL